MDECTGGVQACTNNVRTFMHALQISMYLLPVQDIHTNTLDKVR